MLYLYQELKSTMNGVEVGQGKSESLFLKADAGDRDIARDDRKHNMKHLSAMAIESSK